MKCLILDQCLSYRQKMIADAHHFGIELDAYSSILEMGRIGSLALYPLIILGECEPGAFTVASYLDIFFHSSAIIIQGESKAPSPEQIPPSVLSIINRSEVQSVLIEAHSYLKASANVVPLNANGLLLNYFHATR